MPSRISHVLALGLLCALLSCQQPPDISVELNDHATLINETNFLACDCPEELGYSGKAECDDALGGVGSTLCWEDVLDGSEEAGKEYLDCVNSALRTFSACLASDPFCEDGRFENCDAARMTAYSSCPQLPADLQPMFAACTQ